MSFKSGAVFRSSAIQSNVEMAACPCMFNWPARMNTLSGLVEVLGQSAGLETAFHSLPVITRPRLGIDRMNAVTDDASVRESEPYPELSRFGW